MKNTEFLKLIAESQHRVGNSFQNLISFFNVRFQETLELSARDRHTLINHIAMLAGLHKALADELYSSGQMISVNATLLLQQLVQDWQARLEKLALNSDFEELLLTPRKAIALCSVSNEIIGILVNLQASQLTLTLKLDSKDVKINVSAVDQALASNFHYEYQNDLGLRLAQLLSTKELLGTLDFENDPNGQLSVRLEFPLIAADS